MITCKNSNRAGSVRIVVDPGEQEVQTEAAQPGLVRQSSSDEWPDPAWHPLGGGCARAARRLSQHREAWAQAAPSPQCSQTQRGAAGYRKAPPSPQRASRHCHEELGALTLRDLGLVEAKPMLGPLW